MSLPQEYHLFRNVHCALRFLEREALEGVGVISDDREWEVFSEDPSLYLISLDDKRAAALWGLLPIESRTQTSGRSA